VYLQGDYHLVSPCHYLDVRIKQMGSSSPLRLLRSEQPHRTYHPQPPLLPQRDERQAAVSCLTSLTYLDLSFCPADGRGEAGAAHRHPQPGHSGLMMVSLPPPTTAAIPPLSARPAVRRCTAPRVEGHLA
jgi:hypothetical protein